MSLQYAILGLLELKSMTGYELKKLFDESVNQFWAASISQIYRELGVLENKQYLDAVVQPQSDRPDKKIYTITEQGKAAFKEWITHFPERLSKETRDEFTLRIFFGAKLGREEMIGEFQRFKDEKIRRLQEIESLKNIPVKSALEMNLFHNESLYWKFVLRRASLSLEILIQWADECLGELMEQVIKETH